MVPKIGIKQFCVSESGKKGNEIKFDGAIDQHDNIFRSENIIDFFFTLFDWGTTEKSSALVWLG